MIRKLTLALLGATMLVSPALSADPTPVPASALVKEINIPHQQFTLKNGLRVIVHTDRKAPVVAVSIWYDIGSKHEPKGKTGFAHLFEHLMFNGSENAPGDFFQPLQTHRCGEHPKVESCRDESFRQTTFASSLVLSNTGIRPTLTNLRENLLAKFIVIIDYQKTQ